MLKTRVIPTILTTRHQAVKGQGFDSWRLVGLPQEAVRVYSLRDVDELVILDVSATQENRYPDLSLIRSLADACTVPFTVGGGIRSLDGIRDLLMSGADKVVLNTAAVELPDLVTRAARTFGSQCVVVSIDARKRGDGHYEVFTRSGSQSTGYDPVDWAYKAEERGAGEILLTAIANDGSMNGYDIDLIRSVTERVSIPVIASGGAGKFEHLYAALAEGGASAVAASAMFLFRSCTPREAKDYLRGRGVQVRSTPVGAGRGR